MADPGGGVFDGICDDPFAAQSRWFRVRCFSGAAHDAAVPGRDVEGGEGMALRELQAMQGAYELLSPLDASAQQRVLAWLSASLADIDGGPLVSAERVAPVEPVADVPADIASADNVADAATEQAAAVPGRQRAAQMLPAEQRGAAVEGEVAVEPEPETVAEPPPAPRPKRARAAKTNGRRIAKTAEPAVAATQAQAAPGPRVQRPSGGQFLADLTAVGSFKALAEKYGKSIGTIGNWANQLREQGFDIPVGRLKKA